MNMKHQKMLIATTNFMKLKHTPCEYDCEQYVNILTNIIYMSP